LILVVLGGKTGTSIIIVVIGVAGGQR